SPIENELSLSNNSQDIFIEILDGKQKILILANTPHPDVSTLKQTLLGNRNYEVDDFFIAEFEKTLDDYNLVIFHQLPSKTYKINDLLSTMENLDIAGFYIIGAQTDLLAFNKLQTGLSVLSNGRSNTEVLPGINKDFDLFDPGIDEYGNLENYPPLISPFGEYKTSAATQVLLYQQVGNLVTEFPLIGFLSTGERKSGFLAGTGIWRWRMRDFQKNGDQALFDNFLNKIVQFMSVKRDKSLFRVYLQKNSFFENEAIELDAELYSENYELTNDPDVKVTISSSDQKQYPFTMARTEYSYYLNAGTFPVGLYEYNAIVKQGSGIKTATGKFIVNDLNIETRENVADHNLLYNLSASKGGVMVYPNELSVLAGIISSSGDIKPVIYEQKSFEDLINYRWIMIILILLLAAEWFMRKRSGSY
ncbi:MAG: hypothetical protein K8R53_09475, partial [Bacteroidales bacterium]|nr:hypothetical protein [Bacteroidales bacterium]